MTEHAGRGAVKVALSFGDIQPQSLPIKIRNLWKLDGGSSSHWKMTLFTVSTGLRECESGSSVVGGNRSLTVEGVEKPKFRTCATMWSRFSERPGVVGGVLEVPDTLRQPTRNVTEVSK